MSRIAVVGGHGQIAQHLHPLLVAAGDVPVALVRREEQRAELEAMGAQVRILDLEKDDEAAFGRAFQGCDAVVFAAGGGPDGNIERKRTVDLGGSLKSIAGARDAGIRRFVQISAIGVDDPVAAEAGDVWAAYVAAKRDADLALRATELDWTILRPGRLTDEPPSGTVALGRDVQRGDIPRADVAAVVAAVLASPQSVGAVWNLVGGSDPVEEAVAAAGADQQGRTSEPG
ncbi:SDR family oxidoreductase [Nocardioides sp.]|uniref:SDR family oxidoreductase n=1 Tax=Nocardioides sp. TaxID=35761 RepID=UPI003D14F188